MPAIRKIIHIDMDAFYASVEQRDNPDLRGKPIAVGGGEKRGVTTTASYEARKYGVKSAMPGWQAKKLCPELIFVPPRFDIYKAVSKQIREVFLSYTDVIEPLALDEAYLDVTINKMGMDIATEIAGRIRQDIFEATQLTASAGVSYCKFLAKVASGIQKPNGLTVIKPHQALDFLEKLPVFKFYGVGKVTASRMEAQGILIGKDLLGWSRVDLVSLFGKAGNFYFDIVRGIDERPVETHRPRKSYAVERTLDEDLEGMQAVLDFALLLAGKLMTGLQRSDYFGRTLTLKLKNRDFITRTRSVSAKHPITGLEDLNFFTEKLVTENADLCQHIRLVGLTISNAEEVPPIQGGQLRLPL
ncbi:MAG: DNA polymerase IV [Saprospiraceae bacterium]|nr:DNA polymerase IV [Saprospiraceae bacterium]